MFVELFGMHISIAIIWVAIAVAFAIIEALTLGLTTIWFSGGALAAAIASMFNTSILVQVIIFVIVSAILLIFTRPIARKHFNNKLVDTNVDALVGTEGVAETDFKVHETGQVKADGKVWSAVCESGEISKGSVVIIKEIKGVTLTVEKKEG